MARPITANQFIDLLDKWYISYEPIQPNWERHNRNHMGPWGGDDGVHGVGIHHTGSDEQAGMRNVLWNGYGGLPGPLCHAGIDMNGKVLLAGWGRTNHFGMGDNDVLQHVINEDYKGILRPNEANKDGNTYFYGFEVMYSGDHPMSTAQYTTTCKVAAAICTHHGWKAESVIGHGEWQPGKWDPGWRRGQMARMDHMRDAIQDWIELGPVKPRPAPKPKPIPKPTPPKPAPPKTHTVQKGDTLWALAEKHLGDGKRWLEFVEKNPSIVILKPGATLLIIPKK